MGGGFTIGIGGRFGIVISGGFVIVLGGWFGVEYAGMNVVDKKLAEIAKQKETDNSATPSTDQEKPAETTN